MNYFKQGSFYYGRRNDGNYIQVSTYNGLSLPLISVVKENIAKHTDPLLNDYQNEEITESEFKSVFHQSIEKIADYNIFNKPTFKTDELNESDVQQ